jgi:hypothetical protein
LLIQEHGKNSKWIIKNWLLNSKNTALNSKPFLDNRSKTDTTFLKRKSLLRNKKKINYIRLWKNRS